MLSVFATAVVVLLACTLAGAGIARVASVSPDRPYAPVLGLALLTTAAAVAIKLPGRAVTALGVVVALAAVGGYIGRDAVRALARRGDAWAVAAAAWLVACIPFVANERVGLLGVSFNNDLSVHLPWMEALRNEQVEAIQALPAGYPLGPHSLTGAVAELTSVRLDQVVTGLLLAVAVMTALVALAALRRVPPAARVVAAVVTAFAYLLASYYGQGSFKETIFTLLLLTLAVLLQDLADAGTMRGRALVGPVVLLPAALYSFSYFGVVWLVAVVGLWGIAEAVARGLARDPRRLLRALRPLLRPALAAAAFLLVALAPELSRLVDLFREAGLSPAGQGAIEKDNLGNLAGPLSPYEAFGVWRQDDFRFAPTTFSKYAGSAVALVAVGYGVLWFLRRRLFAIPAAAAVCWAVYLYTDRTESPYVSAKALVIVSPLLVLMALRSALDRQDGAPFTSLRRLVPAALAAVFVFAAGGSTYLTLRGAQVGADEEAAELRSLRDEVRGTNTLFLGMNDFYRYDLSGAWLGHGYLESQIPTPPRAEKKWEYGKPFDFDTPRPELLAQFEHVIAPRTTYASEPPDEFELVEETPSFLLYRRRKPADPRSVLVEGEGPGRLLDCRRARARQLAARDGSAGVRPAPRVVGPIRALQEGQSTVVSITLPRGAWNLELQYTSARTLTLSWPGQEVEMIPRQGRPGPFWHVGRVTLARETPLEVTISHDEPLIYSRTQVGYPTLLAATRVAPPPRTVALERACGRYVDWYKLTPGGG
jgi:hypothetical protein